MTIEAGNRPGRRDPDRGRACLAGWLVVSNPVLVTAAGCGPSEIGSVKPPEGVSRSSRHDKGPAAKGPRLAPGWAKSGPRKAP
jgi:hypothetical protein